LRHGDTPSLIAGMNAVMRGTDGITILGSNLALSAIWHRAALRGFT
jgi:hypothetical protein